MRLLWVWAQPTYVSRRLVGVTSGPNAAVSQTALMAWPALWEIVLSRRVVSSATYSSPKLPRIRAASSRVPAGLQLDEEIPLGPPAYSMRTCSRREPTATFSQMPGQSPGACAAVEEVKTIGSASVPRASSVAL